MVAGWLAMAILSGVAGAPAAEPAPRSDAEVLAVFVRYVRAEHKDRPVCFSLPARDAQGPETRERRRRPDCGERDLVVSVSQLTWKAGDLVHVMVHQSAGPFDSSGSIYVLVRDAKGWRVLRKFPRWIS